MALTLDQTPTPGDIIKAKDCIEHAIRVSPKDPAAHIFYLIRGLIYLDLGEIEKAIESCKTSVQLFSTWDTSLWSLIAVLVENGETDEAGKVVQRLLKVDTTTTVAKVNTNFRINNQSLKLKILEGMRKADSIKPGRQLSMVAGARNRRYLHLDFAPIGQLIS